MRTRAFCRRRRSASTRAHVGHGQVHTEIDVEKMKRKFGLELTLKIPKAPTRNIKGRPPTKQIIRKQSVRDAVIRATWLEFDPLPGFGLNSRTGSSAASFLSSTARP